MTVGRGQPAGTSVRSQRKGMAVCLTSWGNEEPSESYFLSRPAGFGIRLMALQTSKARLTPQKRIRRN